MTEASPAKLAARTKVLSREVAFQVARDVFGEEKRGAQAAFDLRARKAGLDARDRAFAAELAYGSIKARRRIDHELAPYVGIRDKALPPAIADVLRLGVYQIRYMSGVNAAPQHAVRVNGLRSDVEIVRAELAGRGVEARVSPFVPESLLVSSGTLGDDDGGRWSVQGEAATMPVDILAPQPGETILELCSGRGNKSVQLAARLGGAGTLVCVEIDDKKIRVLRDTLERNDVLGAGIVAGDARLAAADVAADAVLLDAPCSGIGIIGRHPEARWRKTPQDGARLAGLQAELLRAAGARTRPGGRLVYSVCSPDPREGRAIVDAFLDEHAAFARAVVPERYAPFASSADVVVPAGIDGRDGFYIASLVRAAG